MSTYNPSSGEMEIGGFLGLTDQPVYLACLVNCRVMTAPVSIGRRHSKSGISSHQNTYSLTSINMNMQIKTHEN